MSMCVHERAVELIYVQSWHVPLAMHSRVYSRQFGRDSFANCQLGFHVQATCKQAGNKQCQAALANAGSKFGVP